MTDYVPNQTMRDERIHEAKYILGYTSALFSAIGTFAAATEFSAPGYRFTQRQDLGFEITQLGVEYDSLIETSASLQEVGKTTSAKDVDLLAQSTQSQIAEVRHEKDNLGNVYIDNTELIGFSLLVGAVVGRSVFVGIDKYLRNRPTRYS